MRIVITGVTGHIGNALAARLGLQHELVGIARRATGDWRGQTVIADLAGSWSSASLPASPDVVIHLAQSGRFRDFPSGAADVFAVNAAATSQLLEYARRSRARHFVLASTGGLYGSVDGTITESTPLNPPDGGLGHYFETKRAAEQLAQAYRHYMRVSIVRPFFVYGPGQRPGKLVPRLIEQVRRGEAVRLRGETGTLMNPVHVDDVAALIEACVTREHSGIVNASGGEVTSVRTMTELIGAALHREATFVADRGEPERYVVDTAAMAALLGRPPLAFSAGIAGTVSSCA